MVGIAGWPVCGAASCADVVGHIPGGDRACVCGLDMGDRSTYLIHSQYLRCGLVLVLPLVAPAPLSPPTPRGASLISGSQAGLMSCTINNCQLLHAGFILVPDVYEIGSETDCSNFCTFLWPLQVEILTKSVRTNGAGCQRQQAATSAQVVLSACFDTPLLLLLDLLE